MFFRGKTKPYSWQPAFTASKKSIKSETPKHGTQDGKEQKIQGHSSQKTEIRFINKNVYRKRKDV